MPQRASAAPPPPIERVLPSVCRIHTRSSIGTGFLVALREIGGKGQVIHGIVTAAHVISMAKDARGGKVVFEETDWVPLRPSIFFITDPSSDITICAMEPGHARSPMVCICETCNDEQGRSGSLIIRGNALRVQSGQIVLQTGTRPFSIRSRRNRAAPERPSWIPKDASWECTWRATD